jgi:prepilin-type N-terminal cleavage/methylation domain-containing protein
MSRTQHSRSRTEGFTLMELMVVVAVIAILSAAVVPSFSRTLQSNRQGEAAMLIIEAVFNARSRAARTGRCHRVRVITSDSVMAGGNGGAVAIDESDARSCRVASVPGATWTRLSFKAVGGTNEIAADIQGSAQGDSHVALVGQDVGIVGVFDANGAPLSIGPMLFDSAGALTDLTERRFRVHISTNSGSVVGVVRHVRVDPSGSPEYMRP